MKTNKTVWQLPQSNPVDVTERMALYKLHLDYCDKHGIMPKTMKQFAKVLS